MGPHRCIVCLLWSSCRAVCSEGNATVGRASCRLDCRLYRGTPHVVDCTEWRLGLLLPINTKNLFCCFISLIYLGSDCYMRTLTFLKDCRVQKNWDKTKTHPKAKLQNAPTFTVNESHSQVFLLLVINIKTCKNYLCKRQSVSTIIPIGRYRLSVKWPIGASLVESDQFSGCLNLMAL